MTPRKRSQSTDAALPLPKRQRKSTEAGPSNNNNNIDPTTWRKSRLRPKTQINRTNIGKKYRLNDDDLEGLEYRTAPTSVRIPARSAPGGKKYAEAHMYLEREVEQRAWLKHGGPEGFDEYIEKLEQAKRRRLQHFAHEARESVPAEADNDDDDDDDEVVIVVPHVPTPAPAPVPLALTPFETYTHNNPTMLHLANMFLGEWVFERAYEALDPALIPDHERVPALYEALRQVGWSYPLRPSPGDPAPIPDSYPVADLRAVLARAPHAGIDGPGVRRYFDVETGCDEWRWAGEFADDLFGALVAVINEHGRGVWRRLRWEVYEKSVEMLGGIMCDRDDPYSFAWRDASAEWLLGRLDIHDGKFSQTRGKSRLGWRYNDRLGPG